MVSATGIDEAVHQRPGSLYNTLLLLGPEGVELKHRKLVPTHQERLFHAFGAGDDLGVADTSGNVWRRSFTPGSRSLG